MLAGKHGHFFPITAFCLESADDICINISQNWNKTSTSNNFLWGFTVVVFIQWWSKLCVMIAQTLLVAEVCLVSFQNTAVISKIHLLIINTWAIVTTEETLNSYPLSQERLFFSHVVMVLWITSFWRGVAI